MSQEWNIPCCGAHFQNISIAQSSPHGAQIHNPLQEFSCVGLLPSCHLSITQQLSTIYQSCFLSISFLKPLAKGCKYLRSIPTGISSLAFQSFTALNYHYYYRSKWQKTLCTETASPHFFLCLLTAKFFRAYDKPTVMSSHFWMMHSHKNQAPTASITHTKRTKSRFRKNLVCKHQGK